MSTSQGFEWIKQDDSAIPIPNECSVKVISLPLLWPHLHPPTMQPKPQNRRKRIQGAEVSIWAGDFHHRSPQIWAHRGVPASGSRERVPGSRWALNWAKGNSGGLGNFCTLPVWVITWQWELESHSQEGGCRCTQIRARRGASFRTNVHLRGTLSRNNSKV